MIAPATWPALVALCEATYPREACGWITTAGAVRAATAGSADRFRFSDDDLLALAAATRGADAPAALFHAHPDGPAAPSVADRALFALHPLPHLIVAVAGGVARAAGLFTATATLGRWQRDGAGWRSI